MITIDNYEGYLMRYADGELDEQEIPLVEAFLDAHPDLRDELEAITAPSLRITPPLVTMPGKDAMKHPVAASVYSLRPIWSGVAAAIVLLIVFGIVFCIKPNSENPIIAQNGEIHPVSVSDSPLPDSLYIGRGKPAPLNLAKIKQVFKSNECYTLAEYESPRETTVLADNQETEQLPEEDLSVPVTETIDQLLAQDNSNLDTPRLHTYPNVILVETDRLVTLNRKPEDRNNIRVGSVIENNNIALVEEKSFIGKAIDAVNRFIMRRNDNEIESTLAFSE